MDKRHRSLLTCFLIALALGTAFQVAAIFLLKEPITPYDGREYLSLSQSLYQGKWYGVNNVSFSGFDSFKGENPTRMRQPGYPLFLLIFYWLLGQKVLLVQLLQMVLNAFTLLFIYLMAQKAYGQSLWPGTIILVGLFYPFWLASAYLLTEGLFTFLLALSLFILQRALFSQKGAAFALSGVAIGCAFLTRPIALLIGLLSIVPICLFAKAKRAVFQWVLLAVGFWVVVSPWFVRNAVVLGDYTPLSSDGGYNLWVSSISEKESKWLPSQEFKEAVQDGYYLDRNANERFVKFAIERIRANPSTYVERSLRRVVWVWMWGWISEVEIFQRIPHVFGFDFLSRLSILLFLIIGAIKTDKAFVSFFLLPAGGFTFILLFTYGLNRFIVPAVPFILILSGQGVGFLVKYVQFVWKRKRFVPYDSEFIHS